MNPIHEAGFATIVVAITCAAPLLLLLAALALFRDAEGSPVTWRAAQGTVAALFVALFAATTVKLHARVEDAVRTGAFGPEAVVRRQFAREIEQWHSSANLTVIAAFVIAAPTTLIANARTIARRLRGARGR